MKTKTFYYSLALALSLALTACYNNGHKNDAAVGGEAASDTIMIAEAMKSDKTDVQEIIGKDF